MESEGGTIEIEPAPPEWAEAWPLTRIDRPRAEAWALVLEARGVSFRLFHERGRVRIFVPPGELDRAEREVRLYEEENRRWHRAVLPDRPAENVGIVASAVVALAAFDLLTLTRPGWREAGAADAARMAAGQWWRAATALTLHADELHLAGNSLVGGFLLWQLCGEAGAGAGLLLAVLAGTAGNAMNALYQGPHHVSVGASTAVFGAVGALSALALFRRGEGMWKRWVVSVGAGAALLALLGGPGGRTDYGAHLFGALSGFLLGIPAAWALGRFGRPRRAASILLGLAALGILAGSWALSLR
jgi:rhomboid protease GluP